MSLNYPFLADQIERLVGSNAFVLDYGCGAGQLIKEALARGHRAVGCDVSLPTWEHLADHAERRALIHRIENGVIPFDNAAFDIVIANQVFEHLPDINQPLREIHRVLKPGGIFINALPTREVWWEGHVRLPLAHRLFARPRALIYYLYVMRMLNLGTDWHGRNTWEWAHGWAAHLPPICFYRSAHDLALQFSALFEVERGLECEWMRYRIANHPTLRRAPVPKWINRALAYLCSRLAGRIFVLRAQ